MRLSFNPRTRDGCEHVWTFCKNAVDVSIHAPVMGAKFVAVNLCLSHTVSIHAPVMGANKVTVKAAIVFEFQSTHP